MKNKIFLRSSLFVILVIHLSFHKCFSQNELYSFRQLSQEQGLPGVNIRDIFQDSRGVMWFSIEAIGLCKYYGDKFVLYDKNPNDSLSISNNFVNQVVEDRQGYLWIATDEGLNRYDRNTDHFKVYHSDPKNDKSLSDDVISTLFIDSKGQLWVGTDNGLCKYNERTNTFERFFYTKTELISNLTLTINDILEDENGVFWIGTNKGLLKFDPVEGDHFFYNRANNFNGPINELIRSVEICDHGILWIGTHRGLDRFDMQEEAFIHWSYKDIDLGRLQYEGINHIYNDGMGRLWLGTYTKGIIVIQQNDSSYVNIVKENADQHGLKSDHVKYFYRDNRGLLWVGTKFQGVFSFEMDEEVAHTWPEALDIFLPIKDKHILAFYKDPLLEDTYWVGSKFDGLYKVDINNHRIDNYRYDKNDPNSISSNRIQSISRSSSGELFIATYIGLDRFDENHDSFYHISQLPINYIRGDANGTLWVGAFDGIYVLNENSGLRRFSNSSQSFFTNENLDVLYIATDIANTIWFSTRYNGLYRYNPAKDALHHYHYTEDNDKNNISGNMIRPIYFASDSSVWIGTKANGLNRLDLKTGHFTKYTTKDGLPVNFILAIQEDNQNNIWLATFNGLSKFDPDNKKFTNFNKDYGLQGNIYELGVSGLFDDGSLIFGGHNGFNIFQADSLRPKSIVSPVLITSVKVFDNEVMRDVVNSQALELKHKENQISFEFILTDYADPYRHRFSYILEGVDKEWINSGNRNYVSYSNLHPGEYTFKVKGANEFGNWSDNDLHLNITITPPFYQTTWFIIFLIAFSLLSVYGMYQVRVSTFRRANMELETKVRKRTQELSKALTDIQRKKEQIEAQNEEMSAQFDEIIFQKERIQEINEALNKAHGELKQINEQLDDRVKERTTELVKINQELDRFVYSASHDLSAPLKSILGLVNIAKYENKDKSLDTHLEYMEKSVLKLESVIKSLTQFSRNKGNEVVHKEVAFEPLVNEIVNEYKVAYGLGDAEIKYNFDKSVTMISDYYRLKIIMSNLISNALKYRKEGRSLILSIGYARENNHQVISVRDNGEGIKEEQLEKIFNMFFRANSTVDGSGLGLYIVKEATEKLNGTISVDSVYGEFTEFQVTLPVINGKS